MKFQHDSGEALPVSIDNVTRLEGRVPLGAAVPLGLQHVMAMFLANIAPMIIIAGACNLSGEETARLIQTTLLIAGLATAIQLYPLGRVGSGLPVVMGISFTFVTIMAFIGVNYGYSTIMGAVLVGGIFEGVIGLFAKYWRRVISPIVSSCVVTSIGFSLLGVGATYFGGGSGAADFGSPSNWIVGSVTLIAAVITMVMGKGFVKQISILIGLVAGYITALCLGMVDLSVFSKAATYGISFPQFLPFKPEFNIGAIVSVCLIFLVSATETLGDTTAVAESGLGRPLSDKELSGSICADGFCSAFSSLFGCLPVTSFSQNVGLVAMTGVVNRFTILMGAIILILASFFNVIAAVFTTLPNAVLGGCTIVMFGQIIVTGFEMIGKCGFNPRNNLIMALALSIGIGFTSVPDLWTAFPITIQNIFSSNVVAVVFVVAIVLNLVLPKSMEKSGQTPPAVESVDEIIEDEKK